MKEENPFKKVVISIDNMSCPHCISSIENFLNGLNGVTVKKIKIGKAVIMAHPLVNDSKLKLSIEKDGVYKVKNIKRN